MPRRNKLFITPTLATVIGGFVAMTAAAILIIQVMTSNALLRQLGGELVDLGLDSAETALIEQLHAITEAGSYSAAAWSKNTAGFDDPELLLSYLYGSLSPMEQVSFLVLVDENGVGVEVERGDNDGTFQGGKIDLSRNASALSPIAQKAEADGAPFWYTPVFIPERQLTYYVFSHPLFRDGAFDGTMMIGMSLDRLSDIMAHISTDDITVFLMKEDSLEIVAHPHLRKNFAALGKAGQLPHVSEGPDTFLSEMEQMQRLDSPSFDISPDLDLQSGIAPNGEKRFVILQKQNRKLDGLPVRIGAHFPAAYLDQPLEQLAAAVAAGVGLLLLSMGGAILLARRITQPVKRASTAAKEVADLKFDRISPLPPSIIRELDDLSRGFNSMLGGLTAFNRYVPRTLVQRLLREGRIDAPPEEREVAVLFSDIVGFTAMSEGMSASETADFVNHHLSLLGAEITRYGGTIDKYIGDSIMAFWGAPDHLDNAAEAAALAALGMARAIRQDNVNRVEAGQRPVAIRIGVHMGPLVVGDIGAPERVNYTVIGDTVNAASRLESLGREIDPDADAIILVSQEISRRLGPEIDQNPIGPHAVKGRLEPLEVVRLKP
ncbi:adenylate/guanylate cyclase domain-containing protein [Rhodobacterales bacterium]|nr:adenylate/guanylate cyclase domain-containing protein [Rhodobacterales bacterium]